MTLKNFPKRYKDAPEPIGTQWWKHHGNALDILNHGGIVVLYGNIGSGKTRMAYELARECKPNTLSVWQMKKEMPAYYTTAVELFVGIRSCYGHTATMNEATLMRGLKEYSLLVIDEFQNRGETDFETQKLNQIVDARYQDNLPTILITNHTREQFLKSISPQIIDRIRENGAGLHFDWPSYRRGAVNQ